MCSGLLLILVAVALCGSARLRSDLAIDDDGKETVAQRMVEGYFWAVHLWTRLAHTAQRTPPHPAPLLLQVATLSCVMVAVAVSYLALPNAQADVADLAAKYPRRFQEMAYDLGVDATAGAGAVAEVASIIDRVQTTGSVVTLVLCASLAFVLVAAAKIVTVYEIVQGLMRYLMSLYLALGIGLVYVGSVLILFTTVDALASDRFTQTRSSAPPPPPPAVADRPRCALVPISLLGIGAAQGSRGGCEC